MIREVMTDVDRHRNAFHVRMTEGRYIGHHGRTGALLVMTSKGILRGTGARRVPEAERWTKDGWSELRGLPWEIKARTRTTPKPVLGDEEVGQEVIPRPLLSPGEKRKMYVMTTDVKHWGPTEGCRGCESVIVHGRVLGGCSHNDECRARIEELMSRDELGRRRLERQRRKDRDPDEPEAADAAPEVGPEEELPAEVAAGAEIRPATAR